MEKVQVKAKCQVCGKEIELKVFWKKYCSTKCRMDGYILKRAEKLNEEKSCNEKPKA